MTCNVFSGMLNPTQYIVTYYWKHKEVTWPCTQPFHGWSIMHMLVLDTVDLNAPYTHQNSVLCYGVSLLVMRCACYQTECVDFRFRRTDIYSVLGRQRWTAAITTRRCRVKMKTLTVFPRWVPCPATTRHSMKQRCENCKLLQQAD